MSTKKSLSKAQKETLLEILNSRFEKNMNRHKGIEWKSVLTKLEVNADKLWSLNEMENTGGEPDVISFDKKSGIYTFVDCAAESPKGRRSICYDQEALNARKEYKPANSAINMAAEMGVEVLTEDEYKALQQLGKFDSKTSSWLKTPANIRKLGGAIFADYRFETIFVYHNGAESYYGGRAFRGKLLV
ncbi:MAG: DUF4256 domain-containing protein [Sphingobacteriales bacterium]|nr:DUF4256 domain-containing protein [Sphingobacteriales bacterium]